MGIPESFASVCARIHAAARRSGRDPGAIRLVTVTKGISAGAIREAVGAGAKILGESRIQEALPKISEVGGNVAWHLIGSLQRNKVRHAVGSFDLIHSVDRPDLAGEIDRRAEKMGLIQKVLVQVNVAGEASKSGVIPDEAPELARAILRMRHLDLRGLMTIPPLPNTPEDSRPFFRRLRELAEGIQADSGAALSELSMGMSGDFEIAVEEGATLVRVGTAIFG